MRILGFAAIGALSSVVPATAERTSGDPKFSDYPARVAAITRPAHIRIADPKSRKYASALREAAEEKPDFAGHYKLANWGCGASCVMVAAVDAQTGKVAWLPFTVCCWPLDVIEPLAFQLDSRLLVVHGRRNEKGDNGTYYYRFDGRRFTPVPS